MAIVLVHAEKRRRGLSESLASLIELNAESVDKTLNKKQY